MYGRELLTVCHHPGKFCEHRHCDSGDIVFLICHVISREHTFKGLCEFKGRRTPYGESPPSHVWWPLV